MDLGEGIQSSWRGLEVASNTSWNERKKDSEITLIKEGAKGIPYFNACIAWQNKLMQIARSTCLRTSYFVYQDN